MASCKGFLVAIPARSTSGSQVATSFWHNVAALDDATFTIGEKPNDRTQPELSVETSCSLQLLKCPELSGPAF